MRYAQATPTAVSGQRSVVSVQWSAFSGQRSVVSLVGQALALAFGHATRMATLCERRIGPNP
ncbi:MAG: hypothetical protein F6K50_16435 [Moorea sp. SIO3I7]|uniref:hypothetical protein n=1 Tax=unclassified Moorena TaxID=2683338 RepID=UPI0013C27D92|nr:MULTISPECIES: hypothetical protein [unclassified Moorena]NEN97062.1 hypothetical protein [Moorena sp. SIO3I7]NEO09154.1 hypothetical protein [Moorena sp. SIO3I8]NEO22135.1 hypothetical protein [Moorena sp. SIO4A5]NEQ60142.1 hypothetical protein [Moorena sp. SIO4A1]